MRTSVAKHYCSTFLGLNSYLFTCIVCMNASFVSREKGGFATHEVVIEVNNKSEVCLLSDIIISADDQGKLRIDNTLVASTKSPIEMWSKALVCIITKKAKFLV